MRYTLAKRLRHDEELLKNTTQGLMQSAGLMLLSMLGFLAICACILLLGR